MATATAEEASELLFAPSRGLCKKLKAGAVFGHLFAKYTFCEPFKFLIPYRENWKPKIGTE